MATAHEIQRYREELAAFRTLQSNQQRCVWSPKPQPPDAVIAWHAASHLLVAFAARLLASLEEVS